MSLQMQSSIFGKLVRLLTGNKVFQYPDEVDPTLWKKAVKNTDAQYSDSSKHEDEEQPFPSEGTTGGTRPSHASAAEGDDGVIVVGWYGEDDPENPQNWSYALKHLITFQMCLLNFGVYIASSIYVPGEQEVMEEFEVGITVATLGLSLFTLGYGMGPMLWSPLSEMPKVGRSGIFFWTLLAFIILQLPVGLAPDIGILLFFRWLTGFFGSPCLATGGGTITDVYKPTEVPYLLCIWASAGILGPAIGPVAGGYLVPAMGWRWTIWAFTCVCSFALIVMFFSFPETSADNILMNRAKRFRKTTGNDRIKSQAEIDTEHLTSRDHLGLLGRAFTLTFFEPIVFLMNLYAGLLYGVLFTWFESFPFVFGDMYKFTTGQQGLVFIGILVFAAISVPCFLLWIRLKLVPKLKSDHFKPEMVLPPAFVGSLVLPICLFWFGWTSRESIHWIVPIVGSGLFSICIVTLFNSLFNYLGIAYAQFAASIFAGSALFRASFGASFPLFARSLFLRLGVGPGNSLLGGIAVLFIPFPFVFYYYGERIRSWSKNTPN